MKRLLSLLALLVLCDNTGPLFAQEPVEIELEVIKKLRERGWNDLAKAKIEELLKRGDPALNATLPLELARLNIAAARTQDPDQRLATYAAARKQMEDFIVKNKGKGQAALAQVDVARLTMLQGQALLARAMREEDPRERHEKARPAEAKFIEAGKELEAAIKLLDAAAQDPLNAALKNTLTQELRQARFDQAIILFDQAKTYINRGNLKVSLQRAEIIVKASKSFLALRSEPGQVGWLANAWLMKCAMETDAPDEVRKYYKSIMDRAADKLIQADIQPAVRLARYFHMQDQTLTRPDEPETFGVNHISGYLKKPPPTELDRLKAVEKEGEAWLKAYPNHLKSYEGQGVRYELAYAYLALGNIAEKDKNPKDKTLAETMFKQAEKHFKILGDYDGELAGRSRDVAAWLESKNVKDSKTELKTFSQFYTKAMIERKNVISVSRKFDDLKADPKALEAERKQHLKEVINAFTKAINVADGTTPGAKLDDARYYLCGAYLAYGDPYRGAIVGEALGRTRPNSRGAEGAATALATYAALLDRHPDDAGIKNRLNDLADYVLSEQAQKTWAANPVTSRAHYHLGMAAKKENNPKKAIEHLAKITPDFTDYVYTQGQLAFIAEAARESTANKMEQKEYADAFRAAIKRIPKIQPKNEIPPVIAMYFFAKIEDSKYQHRDAYEVLNAGDPPTALKKFNDMAAYVKGLRAELDQVPGHISLGGKDDHVPNGKISQQNHDQLQFAMAVMLKYADLGMAEVRFRGKDDNRFDQVLAAIKTEVDDTLAKAQATPAGQNIKMKDYDVTSKILSMALRASVQKGDVAKGKAILDVLQRVADENDVRKSGNVVADLLNDIAGQIRRLKEANDPTLQKTKGNYIAFLDVIAKELETKGFDNSSVVLMAHAYNSLELPTKAAPLFAKYKAPANLDKKAEKPKAKETDKEMEARQQWEEEVSRYWGVQIEHIRALRACKDKDSLKQAEDIAKKILGTPTAKYQLQAMMEKAHLIEDQGRFREAYGEWTKFLKLPSISGPNLAKPEVQKIYFPAYFYSVRTLYKTALFDKDIKDRPKLIAGCAAQIIKLENSKSKEGWQIAGPMFMEFFKDPDADKLKKEYDKLKALQEKGSSLRDPRLNADGTAFCAVEAVEAQNAVMFQDLDDLKAKMEKILKTEEDGKFRDAYGEWTRFLKTPSISGSNLAKPEVQKIYFKAYVHSIRTLYKTAMFDKDIKDRPKLISGCANQILKLENSKSKEGWKIAGPLVEEFFKDPGAAQLKQEYDRLKALQQKGSSLWNANEGSAFCRAA